MQGNISRCGHSTFLWKRRGLGSWSRASDSDSHAHGGGAERPGTFEAAQNVCLVFDFGVTLMPDQAFQGSIWYLIIEETRGCPLLLLSSDIVLPIALVNFGSKAGGLGGHTQFSVITIR